MKLSPCGYALPVTNALTDIIESALEAEPKLMRADMVALNFRDPNYSPRTGGYHPVEIGITGDGVILYITEFSYVGHGYFAELCKELDFDFTENIFQQFDGVFPMTDATELFELWQQNFCYYFEHGVYCVTVQSG
jgi:hypothetical protein